MMDVSLMDPKYPTKIVKAISEKMTNFNNDVKYISFIYK